MDFDIAEMLDFPKGPPINKNRKHHDRKQHFVRVVVQIIRRLRNSRNFCTQLCGTRQKPKSSRAEIKLIRTGI